MKAEKTRGDHRIFKPVFIERSCPDLRHGGGSKKRRFQSVSADCGKWIFRYIVWPVGPMSRKIQVKADYYKRFVDQATSFDYLEYGADDTYDISYLVVRIKISDNTYECLIINLPRKEFDMQQLKLLYFARWSIESSFRKLKYTIGLK